MKGEEKGNALAAGSAPVPSAGLTPGDSLLASCRDLACGYPGRIVLEGVNLELRPGAKIALLGPNGSGKSTLLKTLCGAIPILKGAVDLSGTSVSGLSSSEIAKRASYVPQEEAPPFRFSVRQVVVMGRLPHSTGLFDTAEDLAVAEEAMRLADCLSLADRPITEISGGEKQRVLVARALAQQAPVMLLDEPTSHLDVAHQMALSKLIRDLSAKGFAILAAVHDLNLASEFAEEAILLNGGRVSLQEPIREALRDPRLDEAYGVAFRRIEDGNTLRVFPEAPRES